MPPSYAYNYANVRRWTKKVDVFTRDLLIFPIHCHGNHWTLAVINMRMKRLEYYDSLRGGPDAVLTNLRRWLQDEHAAKKGGAAYDTSDWTEKTWASGTPVAERLHCGVFMTRRTT